MKKTLALTLAFFSLILEIMQSLWHFYGRQNDWRALLHTTLCGLCIFVGIFALISNNRFLVSITYYLSYGTVFAFIFPDHLFGYDRFRFYSFFIIHGMILVNAAYLLLIRGTRADLKAMKNAMLVLLPILILSYPANILLSDSNFSLNFFYVSYPPFEFPVFLQLYALNPLLYTLSTYISYTFFFPFLYWLGGLLNIRKPVE